MSWNYRVCRKRFEGFNPDLHDPDDEYSYGIYEVYYNDDGDIWANSMEPMEPYGTSLESIKECFSLMQQAFTKPLIDLDTIEYAERSDEKDS